MRFELKPTTRCLVSAGVVSLALGLPAAVVLTRNSGPTATAGAGGRLKNWTRSPPPPRASAPSPPASTRAPARQTRAAMTPP